MVGVSEERTDGGSGGEAEAGCGRAERVQAGTDGRGWTGQRQDAENVVGEPGDGVFGLLVREPHDDVVSCSGGGGEVTGRMVTPTWGFGGGKSTDGQWEGR